jgi:signal transduction histidine kinase
VRLAPTTLRGRVTAVATAAIVVVLVAVGWGLVVNHRRELTDSLDERLSEIADGIAADLQAGEPPDLENLGEDDSVAQVVGPGGDVAAATAWIEGREPLGTAVDGQEIRAVDPLPGADDDPVRLLSRGVDTPDGPVVIHVAAPSDDIADSVATLQRSLFVAVPLSAAALAALTWVLVGRTLRPVERIRAEVAEIGGTDLHRRVPVPASADEISRLATTMNDMLSRVEQAQARQRRFVADASHELRSPLTRMRTELEVDLRHPVTADPAATQRSVLEEVVGLQQLVDDLLLLARHDGVGDWDADGEVIDLGDVVARAAQRSPSREDVAVVIASDPQVTTTGIRGALDRAVGNVLDNAIRHAGSAVRVTARRDGDTVTVAVEDDGPGVPDTDRQRIFERFARVDAARSAADGGAGLGLSIAREIVERHGGTVAVDPAYEDGARFVITLPSTR